MDAVTLLRNLLADGKLHNVEAMRAQRIIDDAHVSAIQAVAGAAVERQAFDAMKAERDSYKARAEKAELAMDQREWNDDAGVLSAQFQPQDDINDLDLAKRHITTLRRELKRVIKQRDAATAAVG